MAARKAAKRKPLKGGKTALSKKTLADIKTLERTKKILDLAVEKIDRLVDRILGHAYKQ
jgi:hypothetical protein